MRRKATFQNTRTPNPKKACHSLRAQLHCLSAAWSTQWWAWSVSQSPFLICQAPLHGQQHCFIGPEAPAAKALAWNWVCCCRRLGFSP